MSRHHHDHSSGQTGHTITFPEKAHKLMDHWIKHNDDHAQSYHQWADAFRENGLGAAAVLLESAAELTRQINLTLTEALQQIEE